jgi:uncharacterized protein (TIGR00645 family)
MANKHEPMWLQHFERGIFASRWLQAPMYFGLILAQGAYVYKFVLELIHLMTHATSMTETEVMLIVLGLVDVVMVANLLLMVVIGGYETFVSRLPISNHPDKPVWLEHVDAGVLKVKLATALVTISSIHLLKTFIDASNVSVSTASVQIAIHVTFMISAFVLVVVDKMSKASH